jgi:hypothetical protein
VTGTQAFASWGKTNMARRPKEPLLVPKDYAGQWIAWDRGQTRIVASGRTFAEAKERAVAAGESDPVMAKAPKADVRFVGRPA